MKSDLYVSPFLWRATKTMLSSNYVQLPRMTDILISQIKWLNVELNYEMLKPAFQFHIQLYQTRYQGTFHKTPPQLKFRIKGDSFQTKASQASFHLGINKLSTQRYAALWVEQCAINTSWNQISWRSAPQHHLLQRNFSGTPLSGLDPSCRRTGWWVL